MQASEAMRRGIAMRPIQEVGGFYFGCDGRSSCANGAMMDGASVGCSESGVLHKFQILKTVVICPACSGLHMSVFATINWLNDHHLWTREKIADWLEGVERANEPVKEPEAELVSV